MLSRPACLASSPLPQGTGWVGAGFGWRRGSSGQPDYHTAIDIGAPAGTPVLAVLPGTVLRSAPTGTTGFHRYGEAIVLEHRPGLCSLYAHLSQRLVSEGQTIAAGQMIGAVGDTETPSTRTRGPHLHLEFLAGWPRPPDVDRMDPTPILASVGVIAEPHSRLRVLPGSAAACASAAASPFPIAAAGAIGGGALLLLLAFLASR